MRGTSVPLFLFVGDINNIMNNTLTQNKNPLITSNGFKMVFQRAPNTAYFCQNFNLPSVTNGETTVARPTVDAHFPGPKTTYDPLTINMLVTENMDNYIEIFNWIISGDLVDDVTIQIINSKNNVNKTVKFKNAFPTSMGSISFNVQDADTTYGTVDVTFRYDYFTIE